MSAVSALTYRLSAYEGPLDLLYSLIQARKIDICDIPIRELADQYLDFLEKAEDRDMDSMSEFTLMAATLLEIKSRSLLPKTDADSDDDPEKQLIDSLLEYRRAKLAAELFVSLETENEGVFFRHPDIELINALKPEETIDDVLEGVTPALLYEIFNDVMGRKELKIDRIRSSFKSIKKEMFTIKDKSEYILGVLEVSGRCSFSRLLESCVSKMEMVVTFLAVLELVKTREIEADQKNIFEDIELRKC